MVRICSFVFVLLLRVRLEIRLVGLAGLVGLASSYVVYFVLFVQLVIRHAPN
jgi:hypothetical protein